MTDLLIGWSWQDFWEVFTIKNCIRNCQAENMPRFISVRTVRKFQKSHGSSEQIGTRKSAKPSQLTAPLLGQRRPLPRGDLQARERLTKIHPQGHPFGDVCGLDGFSFLGWQGLIAKAFLCFFLEKMGTLRRPWQMNFQVLK